MVCVESHRISLRAMYNSCAVRTLSCCCRVARTRLARSSSSSVNCRAVQSNSQWPNYVHVTAKHPGLSDLQLLVRLADLLLERSDCGVGCRNLLCVHQLAARARREGRESMNHCVITCMLRAHAHQGSSTHAARALRTHACTPRSTDCASSCTLAWHRCSACAAACHASSDTRRACGRTQQQASHPFTPLTLLSSCQLRCNLSEKLLLSPRHALCGVHHEQQCRQCRCVRTSNNSLHGNACSP